MREKIGDRGNIVELKRLYFWNDPQICRGEDFVLYMVNSGITI